MAKDNIQDENMNSAQDIIDAETEETTQHKQEHEHSAKHHKHAEHNHAEHKHTEHKHAHAIHEKTEKSSKCCSNGVNGWMIASIILFVVSILFLVLWLTKSGAASGVGENTIKSEMKSFIDNNLLQPGTTSTVEAVEDLGGVYRLNISVNGQQITSYSTKDGKVFFPSGLVLEEVANAPAADTQAPVATDVPKTDKPVVEVFVMSYCPYGTQIEKGLLPVVAALGDTADIQVKFVDYIMHGQKESDENLMQYCIQQEYNDQYYKYLQCFLNASDAPACRATLGFDEVKLKTCFDAADVQFGISKDYADKSTWKGSYPRFAVNEAENVKYGVQGSPTLVINGVDVSSARDPNSLKNAICNAFTTAPAECDTALPTAGPSAGFGYGTSASDAAAAQCG